MSASDRRVEFQQTDLSLNAARIEQTIGRLECASDVITLIENDIGKKFTVFACLCEFLTDHSDKCIHAKSFNDYNKFDLQKHTSLLILSSQNAFKCLKHYFECKKKAPDSTSACIVLPKYYGRRYGFMKTMKLLKSYQSNVFCDAARVHAEVQV